MKAAVYPKKVSVYGKQCDFVAIGESLQGAQL